MKVFHFKNEVQIGFKNKFILLTALSKLNIYVQGFIYVEEPAGNRRVKL